MIHQTNSQKMSQAAYERIQARHPNQEFFNFAREFPSLIHSCGLAQAVAFAKAKKCETYLSDLTEVLKAAGHPQLTDLVKTVSQSEMDVTTYIRLSRHALQAAGWIKRYVEAAQGESK